MSIDSSLRSAIHRKLMKDGLLSPDGQTMRARHVESFLNSVMPLLNKLEGNSLLRIADALEQQNAISRALMSGDRVLFDMAPLPNKE